MGYAITWCAVREEAADSFLQALGLAPTGQTTVSPDALIASARLDMGWRMVWYNKYGCPFLQPRDLARLSTERDVLLCLVEEHVMASSSEMWSAGKRKWWLSHEGESGPKGLDTDGELPGSFPDIRKQMEQQQRDEGGDAADVDYIFEIPLLVAKSLCGFKHDEEDEHVVDKRFVVLARNASNADPAGRGFLGRLFGR
jgi:hypothetical protein